jgi:hypothetical protein
MYKRFNLKKKSRVFVKFNNLIILKIPHDDDKI